MPTTRLPALNTLVAGGALLAGLALLTFPASAQQAALVGVLGSKALLVIDGNAPRTLGAGDSASGVKVVSVGSESAVIEADGARQTLRLGSSEPVVPVFFRLQILKAGNKIQAYRSCNSKYEENILTHDQSWLERKCKINSRRTVRGHGFTLCL